MEIGCSVFNNNEIRIAQEAGYAYVELKGKLLAAMSEQEVEGTLRVLEETGLSAYGINAYCGPEIQMIGPGYDPAAAKAYGQKLAARAALTGTKMIGIGSPASRRLPEGAADWEYTEARKQMREFLQITAEAFQPYGMTICLEPLAPVFCNYVNTAEEAAWLLEGIPCSNLGIVIDYYSMELSGESEEDFMPYLPLIRHAHTSDDDGDPYRRSYLFSHKRAVHQKRIRRLLGAGYQGNLTLEMDLPADAAAAAVSFRILSSF
ncbi:MAG: sugar phosphate isomerase/epimerase [Lachnospiraceae bacterium]|nr:sugar phosphate isomerase/epimerase [Lachnospiraceae bacterium]